MVSAVGRPLLEVREKWRATGFTHTPGFAHASGLGAVVNFSFSGAAAVGIQRQRQRTGVSALLGVHTTFLLHTLHPSSHTPPARERW
jgi:hypothetical protein